MSGNAFKDLDISKINYVDFRLIKYIVDNFIFPDQKITKVIGSGTRFEDESYNSENLEINDLDFVVQLSRDEIKDILSNNERILTVRVFGNTVSAVFSHPKIDKLYHVDFMTTSNIENESWVMTAGSEDIKGFMRNNLLCFLARLKSEKDSDKWGKDVKWTIAFPGGLGCKMDGKEILERVNSPECILKELGRSSTLDSIELSRTFEGLSKMIEWNRDLLDRYIEYARSQWIYKKDPGLVDAAINYLEKNY